MANGEWRMADPFAPSFAIRHSRYSPSARRSQNYKTKRISLVQRFDHETDFQLPAPPLDCFACIGRRMTVCGLVIAEGAPPRRCEAIQASKLCTARYDRTSENRCTTLRKDHVGTTKKTAGTEPLRGCHHGRGTGGAEAKRRLRRSAGCTARRCRFGAAARAAIAGGTALQRRRRRLPAAHLAAACRRNCNSGPTIWSGRAARGACGRQRTANGCCADTRQRILFFEEANASARKF